MLVLEELVEANQIDEYLRDEVKKECEEFGEVTNCIVHLVQAANSQKVRVFVEFASIDASLRGYQDLSIRTFNGKQIIVDFYSEKDFINRKFNEISLNY